MMRAPRSALLLAAACAPFACLDAVEPLELIVPDAPEPPNVVPAGWDDPAGDGQTFVVSNLELDSIRDPSSAIVRSGGIGLVRLTNPIAPRIGLELAGLDTRDEHAGLFTLKIYKLADPVGDPSDDFQVPPGGTDCCTFVITPDSLQGTQARTRWPARIEAGRIHAEGLAELVLQRGFERVRGVFKSNAHSVLLDLPSATGIEAMTVDASVSGRELVALTPFCAACGADGPTLLDVYAVLSAFEFDLDGDGLECVRDTEGDGNFDTCFDGAPALPACSGPRIEAPSVSPRDCIQDPRLADGYRLPLALRAVPAVF